MAIDYPNPIDIQDVNDEIWFDIINRTITLKEGYSSEDILVQNDANSRNLGFVIQRYFENEDLSTKKIKIHYINSLGQHDCDDIHSQEIVGNNDDVLSFMWLVSKEVCVEAGNIEFAIEFYNDDGYDWFTKPTQLSVSQGIYTIGEIDTSDDWYKIFRDSKLDKNQGVENSGKVMMVGEDGILMPQDISDGGNGNTSNEITMVEIVPLSAKQSDIGKIIQYIGEEPQEVGVFIRVPAGLPANTVPPIEKFVYNQGDFAIGAVAYSACYTPVAEVTSETEGKYYYKLDDDEVYFEAVLPDAYEEGVEYYTINYETPNYYWKPIQSQLVSGENIKTINGQSILGSGDITIEGEPNTSLGSNGVTEAQKQTLLAVVNAIGLFNVPNAQTLIDNFNKAWNTVNPISATSITLDKTEMIFTTEDTQTIVASVLPTNTTDVVAWTSSDTSVATVKDGVVTPLVDGETVITATAGNVSATCAVTVNIYGEIENPVFLSAGYLTGADTATSNPSQHETYNRSSVFSAVPVKKGDTLVCKSDCSSPKNWYKFYIYDTDGLNGKAIWSSEALGWDTVTATQDGYIRTCIAGHSNGNDGLTNVISEYSVTSNGVKTIYTVVDKR